MLNLNNIMIGSSQPKVLSEFYANVFARKPDMAEEGWAGWQFGSFYFNIGEHSEVKGEAQEPQRIIFNLETAEVKEEFERIKEIEGATVIKEPYTMEGWEGSWVATFADPDGNYFQLMTPWEASE
jgi:predicted enzyme related to lactoylglutathione lyase